jgi:hypothetical protein
MNKPQKNRINRHRRLSYNWRKPNVYGHPGGSITRVTAQIQLSLPCLWFHVIYLYLHIHNCLRDNTYKCSDFLEYLRCPLICLYYHYLLIIRAVSGEFAPLHIRPIPVWTICPQAVWSIRPQDVVDSPQRPGIGTGLVNYEMQFIFLWIWLHRKLGSTDWHLDTTHTLPREREDRISVYWICRGRICRGQIWNWQWGEYIDR